MSGKSIIERSFLRTEEDPEARIREGQARGGHYLFNNSAVGFRGGDLSEGLDSSVSSTTSNLGMAGHR